MSPEALLGLMIPMIAIMIPIVAILTKHQQKMTVLMHETHSNRSQNEIAVLRNEIHELKGLVHQQTIALDSLSSRTARTDSIATRLEVGP